MALILLKLGESGMNSPHASLRKYPPSFFETM